MSSQLLLYLGLLVWVVIGLCAALKLRRWIEYDPRDKLYRKVSADYTYILAVAFGPIAWIGVLLTYFEPGSLPHVERQDRKNPMQPEIQQAKTILGCLEEAPGKAAAERRRELWNLLDQLRAYPDALAEKDTEPLIAALDEQIAQLAVDSRERITSLHA